MSLPIASAQQEYSRFKGQFRASDYAADHFGKPSSYNQSTGIDLGSVSANAKTTLDCGKIDIVADFNAQFANLQEQGEALYNSIKGAGSGIPLLVACTTMPQLCGFLRHNQLQLAQSLQLRANACQAIDQAITNQADIGAKQIRAEAKKNCIEEKLASNPAADMSTVTRQCDSVSGLPLRDISNSVNNIRFNGNSTQNVLQSLLKNVNEPGAYDFIVSLLGETEVATNGSLQPLWPKKMIKPREIAGNYIHHSTHLVCNNLSAVLNSPTSSAPSVENTMRKYLTTDDAELLSELPDSDRKLACAALGRAVGLISAKQAAAHYDSIVSSALTNTAVPAALRDEYRTRATAAFTALENSLQSEQIPDVDQVRRQIRLLAKYMRIYNRFTAAQLSSAKSLNQTTKQDEATDCFDSLSCE